MTDAQRAVELALSRLAENIYDPECPAAANLRIIRAAVAAQAAEIDRLRETLVRVTNPDGSPNLQAEQVGAAESYRAAAIHAIEQRDAAERAREEAMSRLRTIHDEHNNPDGAGVHWGTWESLGSFLASLPPEQEGPEGEDGPWADGWEERSKTTDAAFLAANGGAPCDHRWVTDGLHPTACSRCGAESKP